MRSAHLVGHDNGWGVLVKQGHTNAEEMVELLEDKVKTLALHPYRGCIGRKFATDKLVAHESYVEIHRVLSEKIEVLRVKHTAQQWP